MEPGTAAIISSVAGTTSSGIAGILILIILIIIPFIVKFWNWSKEASAQGMLYSQLSEQVQKQRDEIDKVYIQRNILQEQVFELRSKVEHLEVYENTINNLKNRLDLKDVIIAERDTRIHDLLHELLQMKDRVHSLELRLKADEAKFCEDCRYKVGNIQHVPPYVNKEDSEQGVNNLEVHWHVK